MALKQLSKHQVVQDLPIQNIVLIVVMLECGVTALIVQVSAVVIKVCALCSPDNLKQFHCKDIDSIH